MKTWATYALTILAGIRTVRCDSCNWRTRRGHRTLAQHREQRCLG